MEKKPNQVIDEITNVIYPPAEAIVAQLNTIRAIIPSTVKMYESTEDIHTIQPNLDMIQRAINYLRGAPMQEEMKPTPEPTDPVEYVSFLPASTGFNITRSLNKDGEYDVYISGIGVTPAIVHSELFGDIDFKAVEMEIEIPVTCGKNYLVAQDNPALKYYYDKGDSDIIYLEEENTWVKEKQYMMDEDSFQYAFLLKEGRSDIRIAIYADREEPVIFNIMSHVHFKEEPEEDTDAEDSGNNG